MIEKDLLDKKLEDGEYYCEEGIHYLNMQANTTALEYFEKAEKIFEKHEHDEWLCFVKNNKISVFIALKNYDQAIQLCDQLDQFYLENLRKRDQILTLVLRAKILILMNQPSNALQFLRIAESMMSKESFHELKAYLNSVFGEAYFALENYDLVIRSLKKAKHIYLNGGKHEGATNFGWVCDTLGKAYENSNLINRSIKEYEEAHQNFLNQRMFENALEAIKHLKIIAEQTGREKLLSDVDLKLSKTVQMQASHAMKTGV